MESVLRISIACFPLILEDLGSCSTKERRSLALQASQQLFECSKANLLSCA